jgi:transposase InsO family protein
MSMDQSIKNLGLTILRSPPHSPKAKAIFQRVIGTIRSEYLDRLIPLSESHFRSMLKVWVTHYNGARPHMALGPGLPDSPAGLRLRNNERFPHHLRARAVVCARSVLAGLQHEYSLAPQRA